MKNKRTAGIVVLLAVILACLLSSFRIGGHAKLVSPTPTPTFAAAEPEEPEPLVQQQPGGPEELVPARIVNETPAVRWWNEDDIVPTQPPEACWGVLAGATDIRGCEDWTIPTAGPLPTSIPYAYP
jgi:hypothetical protein